MAIVCSCGLFYSILDYKPCRLFYGKKAVVTVERDTGEVKVLRTVAP